MPCHHGLAEVLHAYINAAGIAGDRKGWLFRTARGHNGKVHSKNPMTQPDAWRMIRRPPAATPSGRPASPAYLSNGGALDHVRMPREILGLPKTPDADELEKDEQPLRLFVFVAAGMMT